MSLYAKAIEVNNIGSISANGSNLDITCAGDLRLSSSTMSIVVSPSIDLVGGQIHNTNTIVCNTLLTDVSFNVNTTGTNKIKFITSNTERLTLGASGTAPSFQFCPQTSLDLVAGSTTSQLISMASFNTNTSYTPIIISTPGGGVPNTYNTSNTYGFYTRIANMVFFSTRVHVQDATGLNTGSLSISLPIQAANTVNRIGCNIGTIINTVTATNGTDFYAAIISQATAISLFFRIIGNTSTAGALTRANITNGFQISISGLYYV